MASSSELQAAVNAYCRTMMECYADGRIVDAVTAAEYAWTAATSLWDERDARLGEISHNLGELYRLQGRFKDAFRAARRAVAIREVLAAESNPLANSLETIAKLEEQTEHFEAAEKTYERVLAIRRNIDSDAGSLALADTLGNLGALFWRREQNGEAITHFRQARDIYLRLGATREWGYVAALTNEATLLNEAGRWDEAEVAYHQALSVYGEGHIRSASVLANLAELYRKQGAFERAEHMYEALQRIEAVHGSDLYDLKAARANRGLLYADQGHNAEALRQLLVSATFDDDVLADVFAVAPSNQKLALARSIQGHVFALLSLLRSRFPNRGDLASTLLLRRKAVVQDAEARDRGRLLSGAIGKGGASVDCDTIRKALPEASVLVDYFKYAPYRFGTPTTPRDLRWGVARYLAVVIPADPQRDVELVDVGEAPIIDALVTDLKYGVSGGRDFGSGATTSGRALAAAALRLRRTVFDPLAQSLDGARYLFIAPDGELSLVPFGILPTEGDGGHLIDRYVISYLTSGRDLLTFDETAPQLGPPIVVADPDYDVVGTCALALDSPEGTPPTMEQLRLERLRGSRAEGLEVAAILGTEALLDDKATVAAVKEAHRPRIVHIATHGFFLSGTKDPMRGAGLAFAGANTYSSGGRVPPEAGTGILDALDVSALDLVGTELVVLSACDTARGKVESGEGVFGLRRAFTLAGARTLIMSLWKVHDDRTKNLMVELYLRIAQSMPHAEALRCAQLALRRTHPDPGTWGAFICQSDARSITAHQAPVLRPLLPCRDSVAAPG